MPTTEQILGFSNRWYGPAMKTAQRVQLSDTLSINIASPSYFAATKIEAFTLGELVLDAEHLPQDVEGR